MSPGKYDLLTVAFQTCLISSFSFGPPLFPTEKRLQWALEIGSRIWALFCASSAYREYRRTFHFDLPSSELGLFIQKGLVPKEELDKKIDNVNKTSCTPLFLQVTVYFILFIDEDMETGSRDDLSTDPQLADRGAPSIPSTVQPPGCFAILYLSHQVTSM